LAEELAQEFLHPDRHGGETGAQIFPNRLAVPGVGKRRRKVVSIRLRSLSWVSMSCIQ
jgi:hypothetical protein